VITGTPCADSGEEEGWPGQRVERRIMNNEANISYKWVYENFVIHALLTEGLAKGSGGSTERLIDRSTSSLTKYCF